jgi:hydrogenase maturation protease
MMHDSSVPPSPLRTVSASGTVVLGLGNPLLCDDAVGLRVAAALQERLDADPVEGVTVVTSLRGGFDLIDLLAGASHAIIIDCLDLPEPQPGRVRRLDLHQVAGAARLVGGHDLDVASAVELAAEMGIPMPEAVEIYGVEAAEIRQFGEHLTPAVEAAVETLSRDLHAFLKEQACPRGSSPP